jgi:hypothetical protein
MATCLDLTYSRAVNTTLAVEAKNSDKGKPKRYAGEGPSQGSEKQTRLVIRPFNPNRSSPRPPTYPFRQPVFNCPTPAPAQNNQPSAPGALLPFPVPQVAALIMESLCISSKTAPIQSTTNQTFNRLLGTQIKEREHGQLSNGQKYEEN